MSHSSLHCTDSPRAGARGPRTELDAAAAARIRRLVQSRQPAAQRPATIDALVTTYYTPPLLPADGQAAGLASHAAETAAAITLNAAFGAIATIHVLFERAHHGKGCALVRAIARVARRTEVVCVNVPRQPTCAPLYATAACTATATATPRAKFAT